MCKVWSLLLIAFSQGGPLFCLHQDQPMLVGVARTSTGCESQPNYGHATFTNVAWWNKWMRQVIEKRDSTIHCLEPFEIIKIDRNSTNFARMVKVPDQYLHLRLNQTNKTYNESSPETKKIFQCKTVRDKQTRCFRIIRAITMISPAKVDTSLTYIGSI